jgi:hypothetical protein
MKDFVDHLITLAPEGETFLCVRQKPTLKDGEIQLHADGAIKATWPAYLPSKRRKEGEAWYGNTASFIIDRFKDGHPSASAANCEYALVMVLDDVGEPEKAPKLPPLEPTWKMETSPGSFQWGYVFSEQPTKDEFSAAIVAIAEAGYTDRGAINPVRNFRLPGSVNLKPGRDNYAAQLREFHPERDFTLEQIIQAFGVVPAPVGSANYRPIRISDTGSDDVLVWLSENGKLLTPPNREGWAAVVCPNAASHSDGNPEGRYLPATRAFCCYHSHCGEIDSRAFLDWVAEQGGPSHEPGLREELLAMTMESALAKLTPTEAFPDAAAAVVAEVERKELGRVEKEGWWERFAYIQDDDAYFDLGDRREVSRGTFNALFRHISCKSIHNGRKVEASVCFDENRQAKGARSLVGITYAPGEDILCAREGLVYGNRWRNARPSVSGQADVSPWLAHVERMIPDDVEREHVLNVMAFKVQHANRKINHAVLHGGHPGSGKDTMWAPFFWAVGGESQANVKKLDNKELNTPWGYHLESEVLIINELRQPEAADRRALENSLKPVIAAPPEFLSIQRKGLAPYEAVNRLQVVAFSNERMAITIPSNDRRWFVIWSDALRMDADESARLWAWYKAGGMGAVASWLHQRDVTAFNPGASPPMTEAKAIMVETGMSGAESFLVEMMRARVGEFASGALGGPWQAMCDRLTGQAPPGMKLPVAALLHAFREAGWVDMGLLKSRAHGTKKHIFAAPDMVNRPKSELRDMVENPPTPLMRLVK